MRQPLLKERSNRLYGGEEFDPDIFRLLCYSDYV
jgi:hypothetical protein